MNDFMNVRLESLVLFVPAKSFSMKIYQAEKFISFVDLHWYSDY